MDADVCGAGVALLRSWTNRNLSKIDIGFLILLLHNRLRINIRFRLVSKFRQFLRRLSLAIFGLWVLR